MGVLARRRGRPVQGRPRWLVYYPLSLSDGHFIDFSQYTFVYGPPCAFLSYSLKDCYAKVKDSGQLGAVFLRR